MPIDDAVLVSHEFFEVREIFLPFTWNNASFAALDTAPHSTSFHKVFRSGVRGAERLVLMFTPMRYEAPFHSLHHQLVVGRRISITRCVCSSNNGALRARGYIVSRIKLILVDPFSYLHAGICVCHALHNSGTLHYIFKRVV